MKHRRPGLAAITLLAGLSVTLSAAGYSRLQTPNGPGFSNLFWPENQRPLSYVVSYANLPANVSRSDFDGAVRRAFHAWEENPASSISFVEDTNPFNKLRQDVAANDSHLVVFDPNNNSGFFSQSGILAVAPVEFFSSGQIIDADILINDRDFDFSTDLSPGTYDVQHIVAHEVGHFIGLDHSGCLGATMYPFSRPNEVRGRSLSADDAAGSAEVYPGSGFGVGALRGRIVRFGDPVVGAHVVAYDRFSGAVTASAITNNSGDWTINGLPAFREYFVYVEPLDGPVTSANVNPVNPGAFDTGFGTTFYSGFPPVTSHRVNLNASRDIGALNVRSVAALGAMNVTNSNLYAINPGQRRVIGYSMANLRELDEPSISSPDLSVESVNFVSSAVVYLTVEASEDARPGIFNVVFRRPLTNDTVVFTGGIEVRDPAPEIEAVEPNFADALSGATISVLGERFTEDATVMLGGEVISQVAVVSSAQINLTLPPLVAGVKDLRVESGDGQFALLRSGFTATGEGVPPPPEPQPPLPPILTNGGGGGGGGGCDLSPSGPARPFAALPLLALLIGLALLRRR